VLDMPIHDRAVPREVQEVGVPRTDREVGHAGTVPAR
jgi:hypothetical protein